MLSQHFARICPAGEAPTYLLHSKKSIKEDKPMRARDSPICIFFLLKKWMQDKNTIEIANSVYQQTKRRKGYHDTNKENTRNAIGSGAVLQRAAFFCFRR